MAVGIGVARVLLVVISIFGGFSNVLLGTIGLPLPDDFVLGLLVVGAADAASLGGASVAAFSGDFFCADGTGDLAVAVSLAFPWDLVGGLDAAVLAGVLTTALLGSALFGVLEIPFFAGVLTTGLAAGFFWAAALMAVLAESLTAGCAADFLAGVLVFDLDAVFGLGALAIVFAGAFTRAFLAEAFGVELSLALTAA